MLKKFVSSLLMITLLVGCGSSTPSSSTSSTTTENTTTEAKENDSEKDLEQVKKLASQIVDDLGLQESVVAAKDRIIPGIFFFEEGTVSASAFYLADKKADSVGVFKANDVEACKECVKTYLETLKAQLQTYAPDEIFKVDNAIVEEKDGLVVMIVCDDIESARQEANKILGK